MVVCGLNEEELIVDFLEKSIADLKAVCDDWEIVFLNDGSTDCTGELAHAVAAREHRVKVIDAPRNLGTGANVAEAYQHASKDIVFNNTVDAFFDTTDLSWILPHLDNFDSISGCRTDLRANNGYQKLLTTVNRSLISLLFPVKLKAYQTVQFHPLELFRKITIEGRSSFVSPELLIKAHALGYRIGEVDVVFHGRTKGTAKGGGLRHVARSLRDIFKFWMRWVVLGKPLCQREG